MTDNNDFEWNNAPWEDPKDYLPLLPILALFVIAIALAGLAIVWWG